MKREMKTIQVKGHFRNIYDPLTGKIKEKRWIPGFEKVVPVKGKHGQG